MIKTTEKGQALILVTLAAVGLFAFSALAIDGSRVYSDKRHAQNAADTAAMAGALAHSRSGNIVDTAQARATSNGYDDNGASNDVTITVENAPSGVCPANTTGKDITVTIVSQVDTTLARVIGRARVTNAVTATSRSCSSYQGPPFNGNAIVSLAPSGTGFDAHGTPQWSITGGGIFVNSSSSSAATCGGSAGVVAPSVTAVGGTSFSCHTVSIGSTTQNTGAQVTSSSYSSLLPREPACNGTATKSGGKWRPETGKDGSQVFLNGDMDFAAGLYCIMDTSVGPYHGQLTGTSVTFYVPSTTFQMKFNGSGNSFNATAPTSGEYKGVLMYFAPNFDANGNLLNTQALDLRGNGDQDTIGAIIAPSADVTMFGNSDDDATINSQIIAYQVDAGGNADIILEYHANDNYQATLPITLTLLK